LKGKKRRRKTEKNLLNVYGRGGRKDSEGVLEWTIIF
jgi:hypothetical protein